MTNSFTVKVLKKFLDMRIFRRIYLENMVTIQQKWKVCMLNRVMRLMKISKGTKRYLNKRMSRN